MSAYVFNRITAISAPGSATRANEDRFYTDPQVAMVVDGATGKAKGGRRFLPDAVEGSDPAWLAQQMVAYAEQTAGMYRGDLRDYMRLMATGMKAVFAHASKKYPDAEKFEMPCAQVAMATLNDDRVQIARLGDIETLVEMRSGEIILLPADPRHVALDQEKMDLVFGTMERTGCTLEQAKKEHDQIFCDHVSVRNTRGQAGIINTWIAADGTPDLPDDAGFGYLDLPAAEVKRIALMSDGFHAGHNVYHTHNQGKVLSANADSAAEALLGDIRAAENADSAFQKFPRFKKSDDATLLLVQVGPHP